MTPATAFSIAIRVIALGFGVSAITSLSFLGQMISQYLRPDVVTTPWGVISLSLAMTLSLIAAVIFYRNADRFALSAYGGTQPSSVPSAMTPRDWLLLAIRTIGILCIVLSVPQLVGQGVFYKTILLNPMRATLTHLLPGLIQVVIGIIFVRKADEVAGLVLDDSRTPQD